MGFNRQLFESMIDRTREHHFWTGATDRSGTGQFKVDGKIRSPAALVREHSHGEVPTGYGCPPTVPSPGPPDRGNHKTTYFQLISSS